MDTTRNDPCAGMAGVVDDLSDFQPKAAQKPVAAEIRAASEAANFPSRSSTPKVATPVPAPVPPPAKPGQRRRRTGRNRQINIKMTEETANRLTAVAEATGWFYGEIVEKALDALERENGLQR